MSEQLLYYAVERPVFDADKQFIGAALGQLMLLPNANEYFAPASTDNLHTTLLSTREFAKIAQVKDDRAPIHVIPPELWGTAIQKDVGRLVGSHDSIRAHVTGFSPLIDAKTNEDGWKSLAITIRNPQLLRERAHVSEMAGKLTIKRVSLRTSPEYRHHITLGAIDPNNYDPAFMIRAQKMFNSKLVSLDPVALRATPARIITGART